MSESLPVMLKELRLPAFTDHYLDYQHKAVEQNWGYDTFLSALCEQELARRYTSRIINWTREANLPKGKSLATLALTEMPEPVQKQIAQLRDHTQWAFQADNILLFGPSGVGKSHIAAAPNNSKGSDSIDFVINLHYPD